MGKYGKNVALDYLRDNYKDWDFEGRKPALVLCHLQNNLVGAKGSAMPGWIPKAKKGIDASGMVDACKDLADAFRTKGYPVVFIQADGNPVKGVMPDFGETFEQIKKSPVNEEITKEEYDYMWGVIDEMEFDRTRDYYGINWYMGTFTESGLDLILRSQGVDTIVWGGFALNSVIYTSTTAAVDKMYSCVIPVDASYVCVPGPYDETEQERVDRVVAEAIVRHMAPTLARCTDVETVMERFEKLPSLK